MNDQFKALPPSTIEVRGEKLRKNCRQGGRGGKTLKISEILVWQTMVDSSKYLNIGMTAAIPCH